MSEEQTSWHPGEIVPESGIYECDCTTEALIGGITGSLHRPQVTGRLRLVGKTVLLKLGPAQDVADHLTAAGPDHPWTGVRFWNTRTALEPVLVAPVLVAVAGDHVSGQVGSTVRDAGAGRRENGASPPALRAE